MESNYINLLKRTLIDFQNIDKVEYHPLEILTRTWKTALIYPIHFLLKKRNFAIAKIKPVRREERLNGSDWPANALTMVGLKRLDNIEFCMRKILEEDIQGDFIETGVWRGGAAILMKGILKELEINNRTVWLADSFEGLPKPNATDYPADKGNQLHTYPILTCSLEEVRANFEVFDLLDEQVKFIKGWFKDTLPSAPIDKLSLLRLDGDLYESTALALKHLYPLLSSGGYIIIDDYNAFPFCKAAVDDYRKQHHIHESMFEIDAESIYWRKA